ncbi:transglutaminase-like domain-containing protein [Patescibacteria group bacterium]|nr:transglutaminase-like domain-containing protein [Patescibacteria group bacterium]
MVNFIREHNPKSIVVVLIFLLLTSFRPIPALALDNFTTDQKINYVFDENGAADITNQITLTNKLALVFAKEYILTIPGTIGGNIAATDQSGNILKSIKRQNGQTSIIVQFADPSIGKDAVNTFQIGYHLDNVIVTKGKTRELELPQAPTSDSTTIALKIPQTFGHLAYSSLKPTSIVNTASDQEIEFRENNSNAKILLAFGDNQLFDFHLTYFLTNPNNKTITEEIAIPPSGNGQKVVYKTIDPPPLNVTADADNNWLAEYNLTPFQKITVNVIGQVKITGDNDKSSPPSTEVYTQATHYWPTGNSLIAQLAPTLTTPKAIYDYVVSTLNYDYNRLNNAGRRTADQSLENKDSALCTDFTDLFVTLARANHIPAREIEGFAYSNNTKIKPVNANADILHAWPQFYDSATSTWKSIDPTWEKTTNGIDYFTDLDLNHFAFVIHGVSDIYPPPPGSYRNDNGDRSVDVNFATTEIIPDILPLKLESNVLSNPNLIALTNIVITASPGKWQKQIPLLPPKGHLNLTTPSIPFPEIVLPQSKSITYSLTSDQSGVPQTIEVVNRDHYFYLTSLIAIAIILLTGLGIIITKSK